MATATAPRNDVYLSILAGRVLTALADLAAGSAWSDRIQKELESGIAYCQTLRDGRTDLSTGTTAAGEHALRRLASGDSNRDSSSTQPVLECDVVEGILRELLNRPEKKMDKGDLLIAIKFFSKNVGPDR